MSRRRLPVALAAAAVAFDPRVPSALAKGGFVLAVALAGAAWSIRAIRFERVCLALCALALYLVGVSAFREHAEPTALVPWLIVPMVVLAQGGRDADRRREDARLFATLTVVGTSLVAAGERLLHLPIDGGHGNPNALGLVVAACLPLALVGSRLSQGLVLLAALPPLIWSDSRTAWLALLMATLVFARGRVRLLGLPMLALLVVAAMRGDLATASAGRLYLAKVGLRVAQASGPFGTGVGGYARGFLEAQALLLAGASPKEASRLFVHAVSPHGDWLGLLATGGPLALALAVAPMVWLRVALKGHRREAVSLFVVALSGFGDDVLVLPVVGVAVALAIASVSPEPPPTPSDPRGRLAARFLAFAVLASGFGVMPSLVRRYASQRLVHVAERATRDADAHRLLLERARRIDSSDGEASLAAGLAYLAEGEPDSALLALRASEGRLANVGTSIAIGNAELALGHPREAVRAYGEAVRLDPGSFRAHANLVEAHRLRGAFEAADRELALARTLQPHHPKLEALAESLARSRFEAESRGAIE